MYPTLEDHWRWHWTMLAEAREAQDIELTKYHEDALAHLDLDAARARPSLPTKNFALEQRCAQED